jgi:hypothetical protein
MAEDKNLSEQEVRASLVSLSEHPGWKIIAEILEDNVNIIKDIVEDKTDDEKLKIKTIEDWKITTTRMNDRQKLLRLPERMIREIDLGKGMSAEDFDAYE